MKKINKENKKFLTCVGIIMDGNRRWAKEKGLPVFAGHHSGYKKLKEVILWAKDADIKNLIIYAFSTENWNRSKMEVNMLMKLFGQILSQGNEFKKEDVKVTFVGQKKRFAKKISDGMDRMECVTNKCKTIHLSIALSYGGRAEIISTVNTILQKGIKNISEKMFTSNLWTGSIPDPDIIIRTGGERRLSNFLPWQSVYSELFFVDTYWPAFTKREFKNILYEYSKREKRKGK
jgi:undecaprenyl diphosphate synthase